MSHLQQQAQEKDAEVHRQQRELQALRVSNIIYALIIRNKMSHFQQQAQEKDTEVHRQQRELQALRVRIYCYKLAL